MSAPELHTAKSRSFKSKFRLLSSELLASKPSMDTMPRPICERVRFGVAGGRDVCSGGYKLKIRSQARHGDDARVLAWVEWAPKGIQGHRRQSSGFEEAQQNEANLPTHTLSLAPSSRAESATSCSAAAAAYAVGALSSACE